MCLITNNPTPLVAVEDIPCYKVVRVRELEGEEYLESPHMGTLLCRRSNLKDCELFPDKFVEARMLPYNIDDTSIIPNTYTVEHGIHSYTNIGFVRQALQLVLISNKLANIGFVQDKQYNYIILQCIIPKGARYYKGSIDYCSERLIIKSNILYNVPNNR